MLEYTAYIYVNTPNAVEIHRAFKISFVSDFQIFKVWGKLAHFAEAQAENQVTLLFVWILGQ